MNPLCQSEGVGLIPWSPLARGVLAGSRKAGTVRSKTDTFGSSLYNQKTEEADQKVIAVLEEVSRERGLPPAQIALAWLMHKPGMVAPIVGASKPQHLEDAIASTTIKLSETEIKRLEEPYIPHAIAGH